MTLPQSTDEPEFGDNEETPAISGFEGVVNQMRSQLLPGGPAVNVQSITDMEQGRLSADDTEEVKRNIDTWLDWNTAYWRVQVERRLKNG